MALRLIEAENWHQPTSVHYFVFGFQLIDITGVTGSVEAFISYPLGIFIDGLKAIESGLLNTADMKGESNVAIVVGKSVTPPTPDLPTSIGTPLSVYFTTVIYNDQQILQNFQQKTTYKSSQIFNAYQGDSVYNSHKIVNNFRMQESYNPARVIESYKLQFNNQQHNNYQHFQNQIHNQINNNYQP